MLTFRAANEEVPVDGLESVAKTLSIGDDKEVWVALQFYRDQAHAGEVRSKMMQDKSLGSIMKGVRWSSQPRKKVSSLMDSVDLGRRSLVNCDSRLLHARCGSSVSRFCCVIQLESSL